MKYFLCLTLLLIPTVLFAGGKIVSSSGDWKVIVYKDDFTDKVSCAVYTKNTDMRGKPGIYIFAKHDVSGKHILLTANGSIDAVGITYRVDKNDPVTIGHKYEFQTDSDSYIVKGVEFNRLVNDFKSGNSVVYQGHSGNQFVDDTKEKVSLIGFTKKYSIAEKCEY